jgi:hypothetical protein
MTPSKRDFTTVFAETSNEQLQVSKQRQKLEQERFACEQERFRKQQDFEERKHLDGQVFNQKKLEIEKTKTKSKVIKSLIAQQKSAEEIKAYLDLLGEF